MKASRYYGRKDIRVEDIPEPEVTPGTVKIKVDWTGICGTDLHEYEEGPIFCPAPGHPHPLSGEEVPIVLGHEFAGVATEVADDVTHISVGDKVAVDPFYNCGECAPCLEGAYNLCVVAGYVGLTGRGGGFAEYVVVRADRVHDLGDVPTDIGALVEPLSVAHHAIARSGAKPGDAVVVFGAGPIGLFVISLLRAQGVEKIFSVELSAIRKEKARRAGAAFVLDPSEVDVVERVRAETEGLGAHVAFECVGVNAAMQSAIESLRFHGTLMNIAIWGHKAEVDMLEFIKKELTLKSSFAYANDHASVVELLKSGKLDVADFITGKIAVEDVYEQGFRRLIENKEESVKILVHP